MSLCRRNELRLLSSTQLSSVRVCQPFEMDVIVGNSLSSSSSVMSSSSSSASPGSKTSAVVTGGGGGISLPPAASRSLRVRTSSTSGKFNDGGPVSEIQLCPSVMSEDTKKMLPPTTETIQTKPFPIRGEWKLRPRLPKWGDLVSPQSSSARRCELRRAVGGRATCCNRNAQ